MIFFFFPPSLSLFSNSFFLPLPFLPTPVRFFFSHFDIPFILYSPPYILYYLRYLLFLGDLFSSHLSFSFFSHLSYFSTSISLVSMAFHLSSILLLLLIYHPHLLFFYMEYFLPSLSSSSIFFFRSLPFFLTAHPLPLPLHTISLIFSFLLLFYLPFSLLFSLPVPRSISSFSDFPISLFSLYTPFFTLPLLSLLSLFA